MPNLTLLEPSWVDKGVIDQGLTKGGYKLDQWLTKGLGCPSGLRVGRGERRKACEGF